MGMIRHQAVLATTWSAEVADKAVAWCKDNGIPAVVSVAGVNSYVTLLVGPDGSKEGWEESDIGNARRAAFIARLTEDKYDDGSSPWAWIEVGWGEFGATVEQTNTKNCY